MSTANGVIGRWRELKESSIEKVRLLHAPDDVKELLESIGKEVKKLLPMMLKEQKSLPTPSPEA